MKKFFRLIFGRLFWTGLFLLAELALIVFVVFFLVGMVDDEEVWVFYIIFGVIWTFSFILMIYIINSEANTSYKSLWLVTVGIFPLIGATFYLLFGNKNTTKRMKRKVAPIKRAMKMIEPSEAYKEQIISHEDGNTAFNISNYIRQEARTNIYDETETTYFKLGDEAFPVMIEELKKAKHYIFLEYFIIQKGKFWDAILDVLASKAKEGVDVRVMYDDMGSIATLPMRYPKKLAKLGIKCFAFNRFKPLLNVKLNNRDHRKILVIDGHVGFTGGINLADEYINHIERFGHWLDNAIMLKGRGVYALTQLFLTTWCSHFGTLPEVTNRKYYWDNFLPEGTKYKTDGYVQPYGDIPFDNIAVGERVYISLIYAAQKTLYITTPYLIIDDELEQALCTAATRGVDVKLLVPHIPDKKIVFGVTRSYYKKLIRAGVKVYEYTPGFVHEKIFICDDHLATVGTINLDYRSLLLHMENGVFLFGASCINDMKKDFLDNIEKSELITPERYKRIKKGKRFLWSLLRLFAPLM